MGYVANNAVLGKANRLKRAEIPFTIVTSATIASIVATIDDEFAGNAEIFVAVETGANKAPSRGGDGGAATSAIDPSATPMNLSCDTGPTSLGFVVLDGPSEVQPANLPLVGDGKNPSFGTPAPIGGAKKVYSAHVVITDGSASSVIAGVVAPALRADTEVTPNGNLNLRVTFPKFQIVAIADAAGTAAGALALTDAVALTQKVAAQTIKGVLHLSWF